MKTVLFNKDHCKPALFIWSFCSLDEACRNSEKFCNIPFLDAAHFEDFNEFKRTTVNRWWKKMPKIEELLWGHAASSEKADWKCGIVPFIPSPAQASKLEALYVVGPVLSRYTYCPHLDRLLRICAVLAGSCTAQDSRIPKNLQIQRNMAHFTRFIHIQIF